MNTNDSLVTFRGVSKSFGSNLALDGIDLDIRPGSIVGLIGANGSGKSTLLRHIVGLYLPDSGTVTTLGKPAAALGPDELSHVGYVHQEGKLLEWMHVSQLIEYVSAFYQTWDPGFVDRYVSEFELDQTARVSSLSPGQRQKLAILLAIAFKPRLMILDEPASALDPIARAKFFELLIELIRPQDRTIVISSHILSDIAQVIDHVIIMDKGSILRDCSYDDLQEEFLKFKVTSVSGPLPPVLPFENIIECRANGSGAFVTVSSPQDRVESAAASAGLSIERLRLTLDELYRLVVTCKSGAGK